MEIFFNLFQIIMLALLYLTLITRTMMLYVKDGVFPFVLAKGKKGFNAFLEIIFFVALLAWSYEIISQIFSINFHIIPIGYLNRIFVENIVLKTAGSILILAGYILFIFSLIAFGRSWRVGIDKDNPGKLIKNGVFSITRNPIFVFLNMYLIGTALLNMNLFFIICAIIFIIGIHYQILQEENFLKENYKQEYIKYTKQVRRYL